MPVCRSSYALYVYVCLYRPPAPPSPATSISSELTSCMVSSSHARHASSPPLVPNPCEHALDADAAQRDSWTRRPKKRPIVHNAHAKVQVLCAHTIASAARDRAQMRYQKEHSSENEGAAAPFAPSSRLIGRGGWLRRRGSHSAPLAPPHPLAATLSPWPRSEVRRAAWRSTPSR